MNTARDPSTFAATGGGEAIDPLLMGKLEPSLALAGDPDALRARLDEAGYVFMPDFFPREDVISARQAVFERLHEVDEIASPPADGIFTGRSERDARVESRGTFWRSVSETWALRRISHGYKLHGLMSALLDAPACAQDYIFLRPAGPGKSTHIHCDAPFLPALPIRF